MKNSKIIVLKGALYRPISTGRHMVISFEDLKSWVQNGTFLRHLFCYYEAKVITPRNDIISKPFLTAFLLRLLSKSECYFEDEIGNKRIIDFRTLVWFLINLVKDFIRKNKMLGIVRREVDQYIALYKNKQTQSNGFNFYETPLYLRTDLMFSMLSGGSVAHISGVLNNLDKYVNTPVFITTDIIRTVRGDLKTHLVLPDNAYQDFKELPSIFFNTTFFDNASRLLGDKKISFTYQRYSLNNYSGVKLSKQYGVPFVLEYNGSEIWINRHWGNPLKYEDLSERIEMLNLIAADLIVVVSRPMKEELLSRGICGDKILINPNGVDPEIYSPDIECDHVKIKYGLNDKKVIGFIGTFGRWHGAEVLAEAFGRLIIEFPEYRETLKLLMIGDGLTMPQVKAAVENYSISDVVIFTRIVPQEEGPAYLAACDVLASPHVPNPDGTPFFGSPTKLFEYMAMGKGIVASDLDQIGEILEHGRTAWMIKPGDVNSLKDGLKVLIEDEELCRRLGKAAREEVVAKYTWREHTRKIIEKLMDRCGMKGESN